MGNETSDEGSNSEIELDKEFNKWWLNVLQREPSYFSEYVKIKRLCRDAYMAGRSSASSERRGEEAA